MKRKHLAATFITSFAAVVGAVLFSIPEHIPARAEQITPNTVFPPLPHVPYYPDSIPLSDTERLGKGILFDDTLSDPPGYACAQCHAPATGFRTGLSSAVNLGAGPQPGVIPGRSGPRTPLSYAYAAFSPVGPFFDTEFLDSWVGGALWDGHAPDLSTQARQPFISAVEMANKPTNGIAPPHAGGYSARVVQKVKNRPYTKLFKRIYGDDVFQKYSVQEVYTLITGAIATFETSGDINEFSSKYDASQFGVPPQRRYTLTPAEERGRLLFFGNKGTCSGCHSSANFPPVQAVTTGKDTFTTYLFANTGVPKNYSNPFYQEPDFNPLGTKFIDYGLGANPNPAPDGTRFYDNTPGDIVRFRGLFQTPTLRNVDKRPQPAFVKPYMHNGVFKSLEQVVRFYNKRNIAVNSKGRKVVFDLRDGPPTGYTPLFAPPEVLNNVINVEGAPGVIGNLGLTDRQELDLVEFLKILSDGFTKPNPVVGFRAPRDVRH